MIWFKNQHRKPLSEMDSLYREVIARKTSKDRVEYCLSLQYRIHDDLRHEKCPLRKKELRKLLNSTMVELKKLKAHKRKFSI